MTKHLSAIHNAWHFWFASSFVFKAQCGSRCVLRCSRLNAALVCKVSKRLVRLLRFTPVGLPMSRSFRWHYMGSV
ncbi:DUF3265 domain-containing protein [Vibrio parahaemolyticus]|nr:DUF3265 domain-containing protein [Vibrio parahaemolyticus]